MCFRFLTTLFVTIAGGTIGQQDLLRLTELVGSSSPISTMEFPTLRDILQAGNQEKEESAIAGNLLKKNNLSQGLAEKVVMIYKKANTQFMPGVNMIEEGSIAKKIEREWKEANDIISNRGKNLNKRKEKLKDKLDHLEDSVTRASVHQGSERKVRQRKDDDWWC